MLRGLLGVRGGGIEAKAATGNGIITDERLNELNETYFKDKEYNRVSVHDPSIVTGYIDEKHKFIDPPGGPMIVEGSRLEEADVVVKSIDFVMSYGYIITFL